jgi:hypothetical protein
MSLAPQPRAFDPGGPAELLEVQPAAVGAMAADQLDQSRIDESR